MNSSKLGQLLKTFNPLDWKKFIDFIESPYFNKNEEVVQLGHCLKLHQPDFTLTKEEAYRACFPQRPFDARRMGVLMNYLLKLAEQFLAIERFSRDPFEEANNKLWEFSERKLHKHYDFLLRKQESELTKDNQSIAINTLRQQFKLAEVKMFHFSNQKVRKRDPILYEVYQQLNDYYYCQMLQYACALISWQLVVSGEFELSPITQSLIEQLHDQPPSYPLTVIYLHIYKAITTGEEENDAHFQELLRHLESYEGQIKNEEMEEIYLYAINFCARKIRKGVHGYASQVLKLYEDGIRNKYLHTNGYLSHWTYSNVVKMGLLERRYDWVESFIHRYKKELQPKFYEDAFHFNLAELYFTRGMYNEVLENLQHVTFSDPHYHLGARMMLIKTFYELDEQESLLARLASFTMYLKRDTDLSKAYQETCLNFCKLLHQILKVKSEEKRQRLKQEIENTKPLAERLWLMNTLKAQKVAPVSKY